MANCTEISPGQPLKPWQQFGLKLVSRIYGGRDVVVAVDLTESVGLNAEGRLRLTQIINDSLQSGDLVYVLLFASKVNPLQSDRNPINLDSGIKFRHKPEVIKQIVNTLPFNSEIQFNNTDIQNAELFTYRELARLNHCRLVGSIPLKPQSVVWLTDAPLLTEPGIDSATWIETPANSPFRKSNSQLSQERQSWLRTLPLNKRSQTITTDNNRTYQLSVVDLPATVQEFCTPAPVGKETCLVTPYIVKMLWLPTLVLAAILIAGGLYSRYLFSLNKKWKLKISFDSDGNIEPRTCYLKHGQKIALGSNNLKDIYCPGEDIRGYLHRKGNKLYLKPTKNAPPILYRDRELTKEELINSGRFKINCPERGKDFDISIKVVK
ncbi:VWA domain-containing protein [Myxosarcina sp. GI1(2024)]